MQTQEVILEDAAALEMISVKVKKRFLDLFEEMCKENKLDMEAELNTRLEEAIIGSFDEHPVKSLQEKKHHGRQKSCQIQRVPGFDMKHIDKALVRMETIDEKIKWLQDYIRQLRQTRQMMYQGPRGSPGIQNREDHYKSLTPYMQAYPMAIKAVQNRIRLLRSKKKARVSIVKKM